MSKTRKATPDDLTHDDAFYTAWKISPFSNSHSISNIKVLLHLGNIKVHVLPAVPLLEPIAISIICLHTLHFLPIPPSLLHWRAGLLAWILHPGHFDFADAWDLLGTVEESFSFVALFE